MTRSAFRSLLSTIRGVGGQSRDESHTDDTSAETHSSSSVGPLDQSLPATSNYHESFAGYKIPPCLNTENLEYEMQSDTLFEGGVRRLMPWRETFRPGGLIQNLHPGCFDSVAETEDRGNGCVMAFLEFSMAAQGYGGRNDLPCGPEANPTNLTTPH
jgi:hypothetical protein